MAIDIKNELDSHSIILSVLPDHYYNESISEMLASLKGARICYVDLNKGTEATLKNMEANGIDTKKIFFIDGVSKTMNSNAKFDNAIILSSPYALTEMGIAISEVIKSSSFDVLLFDSLSTLNVYSREISGVSGKFTSHIVNKLRSSKNKGVLTCLENDSSSELIKQSSLFVDKVLKLESPKNYAGGMQKSVAIVASVLLLGIFSLYYGSSSSINAMAVNDGFMSGSISIFDVGFIVSVIGVIALLMLVFRRRKSFARVQNNLDERKDKQKMRKEFRQKLNNWFKAINLFEFF